MKKSLIEPYPGFGHQTQDARHETLDLRCGTVAQASLPVIPGSVEHKLSAFSNRNSEAETENRELKTEN